jgi:hypothetical protein
MAISEGGEWLQTSIVTTIYFATACQLCLIGYLLIFCVQKRRYFLRRKSTAKFIDCSDRSDWSAPVKARSRQGMRFTGYYPCALPSLTSIGPRSPPSDLPLSSRPQAPEPPPAPLSSSSPYFLVL